jgi:uncharacterized membrane-anchored protein YhcB (DUF1043 family)
MNDLTNIIYEVLILSFSAFIIVIIVSFTIFKIKNRPVKKTKDFQLIPIKDKFDGHKEDIVAKNSHYLAKKPENKNIQTKQYQKVTPKIKVIHKFPTDEYGLSSTNKFHNFKNESERYTILNDKVEKDRQHNYYNGTSLGVFSSRNTYWINC